MKRLFSVLDLKVLLLKFVKKKILLSILYLACLSCVIWQLCNSLNIFIMKPTTAAIELVNSREYPISLTFCKMIHNLHNFDGNFSRYTVGNVKSVSYETGDNKVDVLTSSALISDFIFYLDDPYLCKEVKMPPVTKDKLIVIRQVDLIQEENNKNLHLFIHYPGVLYLKEFGFKYPNTKFRINSGNDDNENAKIITESYDITNDPEIPCSDIPYQDCVDKEIIKEFKNLFGCTYPLKR